MKQSDDIDDLRRQLAVARKNCEYFRVVADEQMDVRDEAQRRLVGAQARITSLQAELDEMRLEQDAAVDDLKRRYVSLEAENERLRDALENVKSRIETAILCTDHSCWGGVDWRERLEIIDAVLFPALDKEVKDAAG